MLAWSAVLLVVLIVVQIGITAWPAVQKYGLGFLARTTWDPNRQDFGIGPQIAGTLYSSILGLVIGTVFGLAVAIVLTQDFLPPQWEWVLTNVVQTARGDPQRGLRPVGHLRRRSRSSGRRPTGCTTTWAGFRSSARG